jgi:hypothetical protein
MKWFPIMLPVMAALYGATWLQLMSVYSALFTGWALWEYKTASKTKITLGDSLVSWTPVFGLLVVPLSLVYFFVLGVKAVFR